MLYSVSTHDHDMEEIEMDDYNFVFCNDGTVVDKKERDGNEVENNVEDKSRDEQSGVRLAWMGWDALVLV